MIDKLNTHYSMTNPASVYDEESLTALELAGRTTTKVNEVVDSQNKLVSDTERHLSEQDENIENIRTVTVPSDVSKEVQKQINNGTFNEQIDTVLNNLNDRVDNLLGSVTAGSTTMDAEVIDLRVDTTGKTHTNAGLSIRQQFKDIPIKQLRFGELRPINAGGGNVTLTPIDDYSVTVNKTGNGCGVALDIGNLTQYRNKMFVLLFENVNVNFARISLNNADSWSTPYMYELTYLTAVGDKTIKFTLPEAVFSHTFKNAGYDDMKLIINFNEFDSSFKVRGMVVDSSTENTFEDGVTTYVPDRVSELVNYTGVFTTTYQLNENNFTITNNLAVVPANNTNWMYYCGAVPLGKVKDIKKRLYRITTELSVTTPALMQGFNLSGYGSLSGSKLGVGIGSNLGQTEFVNPCELLEQYYPEQCTDEATVYYVFGLDYKSHPTIPENTLTVTIEHTNGEYIATGLHPDLEDKIISQVSGSTWKNKNVVFWGDSITAQGNQSPSTFYGKPIIDQHKINAIVRGVGGQSYTFNTSTFYANSDGSYAGRYGQNGLTSAPEGTTEHKGSFCSWDRITTMIPESIRESIDLVIVNGGTNDHSNVESVNTQVQWVQGDTTDTDWSTSSFYTGGDYNINDFVGGIASTIMKLRVWCPNALVVLATPYPRYNTTTLQQYENTHGINFREMCDLEVKTAQYMGCLCIDANSESGIAGYMYNNTVTDGVHPNATGYIPYGQAISNNLSKFQS